MTNSMFVNDSKASSVNVVVQYKGFNISLAFDNGFNNKGNRLTRSEMLITRGNDETVTHLFYEHLNNCIDVEEGVGPGEIVGDITLDTLMYVKAVIDCGKVTLDTPVAKEIKKANAPFVTVYQSVGGWKSVLMTWEEDMNCYTPFQTGHFGYDKKEMAEADARDWADAEEIELKI